MSLVQVKKLQRAVKDLNDFNGVYSKYYLKEHPEGEEEATKLYCEVNELFKDKSNYACFRTVLILVTSLTLRLIKNIKPPEKGYMEKLQ